MNREIKFRAWDNIGKQMFKPTHISFHNNFSYCYHPQEDYEFQLDNKYVMQYTGLKDKNGKEIYEGDIVLTKWGNKCDIKYENPELLKQGMER